MSPLVPSFARFAKPLDLPVGRKGFKTRMVHKEAQQIGTIRRGGRLQHALSPRFHCPCPREKAIHHAKRLNASNRQKPTQHKEAWALSCSSCGLPCAHLSLLQNELIRLLLQYICLLVQVSRLGVGLLDGRFRGLLRFIKSQLGLQSTRAQC